MSLVEDDIKEAKNSREAFIVTEVPKNTPTEIFQNKSLKTKDTLFFSVIAVLLVAMLTSLYMFLSERHLRLAKDAELNQKIVQLNEKDTKIMTLIQENMRVQEEYKGKIEELEFTLRALNDSFDILLNQKKSIDADSASKDENILDLSKKVDWLESKNAELLKSLQKAELDKQLLTQQSLPSNSKAAKPVKKETFLDRF